MVGSRRVRIFAAGAAAGFVALAAPATAANGVEISTPYPDVVVEPGQKVTFDLRVRAPDGEKVRLRVTDRPKGWSTTLRGGGFVVDGVTGNAKQPPSVQLEVIPAADATRGTHGVQVRAASASGSDTLALRLRVGRSGEGGVSLTTEFPTLRGPASGTYTFDMTLTNNTPQDATFSLEARGPEGWNVTAKPAGEEQALTVSADPGGTASITVDADPPDDVVAGTYPIAVRAVGAGSEATAELEVQITGNFDLALTTPDERLNAEVGSGGETRLPLVVVNRGSAPLQNVQLSATPPSGWEITFEPRTIRSIPPGRRAGAIAVIRPSDEALAGDYVVTMSASVPEATGDVEIRTTVKSSAVWGVIGLLLIVGALTWLGWVFRRYGRR